MAKTSFDVEVDGLTETLAAFRGLEQDLRRQANGELRAAARECASILVAELRQAAASCGVPVAARVARSVRVRNDRLPAVQIGGSCKVGKRGAPAAALLWGSEHGPVGDVNHFGVDANGAGYWIAPTTKRFKASGAMRVYRTAVADIMRRYRLL